jgi:sodium pump decarboxylase gamma subunit
MLGFGISVSLIGMGVVFAALIFLIFVINAITAVTRMVEKKPDQVAAPKKPEAAVQQAPVSAAAAAPEDESDVLAAIAAAIAYLSQGTMAVKTITRITAAGVPAWSSAGRQETMNLRQI